MSKNLLDQLRALTTPTVANAIELFNIRPRNQGFMSPHIRCMFPELGVLVGYAVTARFAADCPARNPPPREEFWKHILEFPEPRVLVFEDVDQPVGIGAYFGEVQANIHRRLGCAGVVTNGHVRDLAEARALGFHFFAGGPCVSHAYVDLVDFGKPVSVGGLVVKPGDLVHADSHGVLIVPDSIAVQIPDGADRISRMEQRIIQLCQGPEFSLENLKRVCESKDC